MERETNRERPVWKRMARRMIHTSLWQNEQFAKLSDKAKLLYIGTITIADDDGRLKGNSLILKGQIFPLDEAVTSDQVRKYINECVKVKLVNYYEVNGQYFLEHPNWQKFQTLRSDRKKDSEIPSFSDITTDSQPYDNQMSPNVLRKISKDKISKDQDKASDGDGKEIKYSDSFEEFWKVYPKKIGKGAAYKSWKKIKPSDVLKEKIINAVKMQCNSIQWQKEGGQYIPNPSTWLNQERWNDELKYNNVGSKYAGLGRDL